MDSDIRSTLAMRDGQLNASRELLKDCKKRSLDLKLKADGERMSHRNEVSALLRRIEYLESDLAEARGQIAEDEDLSVCEHNHRMALQAVHEWDGQYNSDLIRLLTEKTVSDFCDIH
jgi:hypothetical protein